MTPRTSTLAARLGTRVRELREQRGLSLSALARRSEVSKATLSDLERGEANPTLATLEALAGSLEVTVPELIGPL